MNRRVRPKILISPVPALPYFASSSVTKKQINTQHWQLIFTTAIASLFYIPVVAGFAFANIWLFWVSFALTFVCIITLVSMF
jgi:hypothetical protein